MEYIYFLPLFIPGLALAFYLIRSNQFDPLDRTILGLGINLAFYPLFFLICDVAAIPVNRLTIYFTLILSLLGLGWKLAHSDKQFLKILTFKGTDFGLLTNGVYLLIILALSAYVRIAIVKDLKVPMWADSYHHTMISQLMIDHQGLFDSWQPYAPLTTFTYHFSFHSLVTSYHWLIGNTMPRSVVVTGQVINFLVVLTCYLLAKYLTQKPWAGNFAALFVGLSSNMPAYYFNWGRYTQLTGLALLPVAIVLTVHLLNQQNPSKRFIFLTGLVIAGLGLSHYGVVVFFILFGLIFVVHRLIELRFDKAQLQRLALIIIQVSIIAGVLVSPWIWNFIQGRFLTIVTTIVAQGAGAEPEKLRAHNEIGAISFLLNTHWYVLAIVGVLWVVWRREKNVLLISAWVISLLVLANPHYLGLPGMGLINNFAVFISLFLPFAVILGNLIADIIMVIQARFSWSIYIIAIALIALGIWGARFRVRFFEPTHQLVTESDLEAMAWIRENVPQDARFLINHSFGYSNSSVVGTDAGWWLPILAGRQNIIPPLSFQEVPEPGTFKANSFYRQVDQVDLTDFSGYSLLRENKITHLYIGQKNGQVWNLTNTKPLEAEQLEASGFYKEIYHLDKVSVLALEDTESSYED